jgi:endonuclease/exonuclease/phosphatase family metal-dependent hydrolase
LISACGPLAKDQGADTAPMGELAGLSLLFAPDQPLAGNPNIFEIQVRPSGRPDLVVRRGGDLPASGGTVTVSNLPVDAAARVTASLHRDKIDPKTKTHSCTAEAPVALTAGQSASVSLSCLAVANAGGTPVRVFFKLSRLQAQLNEQDAAALIAARDWAAPSLFAVTAADGRRISLKQDAGGLTVAVAGEISYHAAGADQLARLVRGEALTLDATTGSLLGIVPATTTLTLPQGPRFYELDDGTTALMLAVRLLSGDAAAPDLDVEAALLEEAAGREFTVVSYNVENLFDQVDDERNASYGDYRLTPNPSGQSSNYGEPVVVDGQTMTWTDAKATGVRRALLGIDPNGPEIIGLTEIESKLSLDAVARQLEGLGYQTVQFSEWSAADMEPTAIGMGVISKFPTLSWTVLKPERGAADTESPRPILKVTLDVHGQPLVVYVNHWKSKGGPESARIQYARALQADIDALVAQNPKADYIVLGDLNSDYNEKLIIEDEHNDADGMTGINDVIKAQGDELKVLRNDDPTLKYNLHYELDRSARQSAWHSGFNWSTLDHMIIGTGLYDQQGVTYVDNSFQIGRVAMPRLSFLFRSDGTTNRWKQVRSGSTTRHQLGGYSDHAPLFARFRVAQVQSPATIYLFKPSRPDATDL